MNRFNKVTNARVFKSADGRSWYIEGVASDNSIDRDGDRMSLDVLNKWSDLINNEGVNFHLDHKHDLTDTVGAFREAQVQDGKLIVRAKLEDPEVNPNVKSLLAKLDAGEKIGLSIGGDLKNSTKEFDAETHHQVRTINEADLYEISAVGIPANGNSYVLGSVYKAFNPYQHEAHYTADCSRIHPGIEHKAYEESFSKQTETPTQPTQVTININKADSFRMGPKPKSIWASKEGTKSLAVKSEDPLGEPTVKDLLSMETKILEFLKEESTPTESQQRGANPIGRIAAEPGKSGSSEVFRTDTGSKPSIYSEEDEAKHDLGQDHDTTACGYKHEEMPAYGGGPAPIFGQGKQEEDEQQNPQAGGKVKLDPYAGRPDGAMGTKRASVGIMKRAIGGWKLQADQATAVKQGTDQQIKDLQQHRSTQEKLHELGQAHEADLCRHCFPVSSRISQHLQNPDASPMGTDTRLAQKKIHSV